MTVNQTKELTKVTTPQIIANRSELTRATSIVGEVIERRNTDSILSNIRFTGYGTHTTVSATDIDMMISVNIPAASDSRFDTTIDGKKITELLKKARKSTMAGLTLEVDFQGGDITHRATLDLEKTKYNLNALPFDVAASVTGFEGVRTEFKIEGKAFWSMINAVKGAISTEETRYYLNGIYMHVLDGQLIAVATDGHRLARMRLSGVSGDLTGFDPVIIPRKAILIAHKLMKGKNCPDTVNITSSKSRFQMRFGDVTILTKVIDGCFPDYSRVIPQHNDKRLVLDSGEMLAAITDVTLISSEKNKVVKFTLSNDLCEFSMIDNLQGSAKAAIPASYDSDDMEIGFNSKYVSDMLMWSCPGGGKIEFMLNSSGAPAIVSGTLEGFDGVIMPTRI